jgi:hypothetical protein
MDGVVTLAWWQIVLLLIATAAGTALLIYGAMLWSWRGIMR